MTQQYAQSNINNNGGASTFVSNIATPDVTLSGAGDQFLLVDPAAAASVVTLPLAVEAGPNAEITVVNRFGTNNVTVAPQGADVFFSAPGTSAELPTIGSLTFRSNGDDAWLIVPTEPANRASDPVVGSGGTTTLDGAGDQLVVVDTSAAAETIALPLAATAGAGARVTVLQAAGAANTITLAIQGADALGPLPAGAANPIAAVDGNAVTMISNGAGTWYFESYAV